MVHGSPDSPVDQDPGLELLIETSEVFMHVPALLSTGTSPQAALRGGPCPGAGNKGLWCLTSIHTAQEPS